MFGGRESVGEDGIFEVKVRVQRSPENILRSKSLHTCALHFKSKLASCDRLRVYPPGRFLELGDCLATCEEQVGFERSL